MFSDDGSYDKDTKKDGQGHLVADGMNAVGWSIFMDGEWHNGSGSLSYTFNESGYYSATAKIDDKGNHGADDGWSTTNASVYVLPVDYIVVLPNPTPIPNRCAHGEQIVFTGHAYNYGEDGLRYYDQYGQPIPDRADDDIKLGATFDWSTNIGSVDPEEDSASTTFTADAGTGTGSVTATYNKCGNIKSGSATVEVLWNVTFSPENDRYDLCAGGVDNETDKVDVTISVDPAPDGGIVDLSLDQGLGYQGEDEVINICGTDYTLEARGPAKLVHGGSTYEAGDEWPLTVGLDENGEAVVALYSSNLENDSAKIISDIQEEQTYSESFSFLSPEIDLQFCDKSGEPLEQGKGLTYIHEHIAKSTSTSDDVPVTNHEVLIFCNRVDKTDATIVWLDQNSDGDISQSEQDEMDSFVYTTPKSVLTTDNDGCASITSIPIGIKVDTVFMKQIDLEVWKSE